MLNRLYAGKVKKRNAAYGALETIVVLNRIFR